MKKTSLLITGIAGLVLLAMATPTFAAEKDKTITITGEGKCAKCALKETEKCHNVIQVEKNGKKVTYYLTQNDVSKKFHDTICKESKQVTATGTLKKRDDGKKELTVTKIDLAK